MMVNTSMIIAPNIVTSAPHIIGCQPPGVRDATVTVQARAGLCTGQRLAPPVARPLQSPASLGPVTHWTHHKWPLTSPLVTSPMM